MIFQSTLLMRGATVDASVQITVYLISIHAPHARSDVNLVGPADCRVISIHAPHARSDPPRLPSVAYGLNISIHAPHARSDHWQMHFLHLLPQFQSTLLMRGATSRTALFALRIPFQSTLLMRGATLAAMTMMAAPLISIHAPHARSDDMFQSSSAPMTKFQSTLLMRGATGRLGTTV